MTDIDNELLFVKLRELSISKELIEENFNNYFIKVKSMHK